MPRFTDAKDREWKIDIDLDMHKRVKNDTDIDIFEAEDHMLLSVDPIRIGAGLYSALEPQITEKELSPEEFAAGLDGVALGTSIEKLHEALVSFFLKVSPAKGKVLQATLSKTEEMLEKSSSAAIKRINSSMIDEFVNKGMDRMDKMIEQALEKTSSA